MSEMSFNQKLIEIQSRLVAGKDKENKFGGFSYRTAEGILKAVKPLLKEFNLYMSINDEIIMVGDRFYVKAIITVTDGELSHTACAFARESLTKKGCDDAQVTGGASSYARKYALNGMWGIDDAKQDPDSSHGNQELMSKVDETIDSCATKEEAVAKLQKIKASPACNKEVLRYATTKFNEKFGGAK